MRAGGAGYPVVESSPLPGASTTAGGTVFAGSIHWEVAQRKTKVVETAEPCEVIRGILQALEGKVLSSQRINGAGLAK